MFRHQRRRRVIFLLCMTGTLLLASNAPAGDPPKPIYVWPNGAPGEKGDIGEERDTTKPTDQLIAGKRLIRLGNVSKPTISIYRPPADKDTGAVVLVCPGGAYHILAFELEGTEVCGNRWLDKK